MVSLLGRDEDKNGDMLDLVFKSLKTSEESVEDVVASGMLGVRRWWDRCVEVLLRMDGSGSMLSSYRDFAKNELFDAVIGVVGVLGSCRETGGLMFRSFLPCSCNAATFAAVGMLNGRRFKGGSRRGSRFFLFCPPFLSSLFGAAGAYCAVLTLSLRCNLTVSTC